MHLPVCRRYLPTYSSVITIRFNISHIHQFIPVHILTSHFSKIHFNIILPVSSCSSKWSLPKKLPHQNSICIQKCIHNIIKNYLNSVFNAFMQCWFLFPIACCILWWQIEEMAFRYGGWL